MSTAALLTEDQRDALQEITNIGMGKAGASIAQVMREFVKLSIPRISAVQAHELPAEFTRMVGQEPVSALRQAFISRFRGEAIVVFPQSCADQLGGLLGYEEVLDRNASQELLLDIGNVLVGACLAGIAEELKLEVGFSAPVFIAQSVLPARLLDSENIQFHQALLVEVNFALEQRSFACHLMFLMAEADTKVLGQALDVFLASL